MKFFETIKIQNNKTFNLEYHQERFEKTYFENFGTKTNINLVDILDTNFSDITRAKVIYNKTDIKVEYFAYIPKNIKTIQIVHSDNIIYNYKFFDRIAIEKLVQNTRSDEIAIFQNGLLSDSSIANIAIFEDGVWLSPTKPLLFGTTLKRYVDSGKILLGEIDIKRFKKAQKIAFLNAMIDFKIYESLEIKW